MSPSAISGRTWRPGPRQCDQQPTPGFEHDDTVDDKVEGEKCHEQRAGVHCPRNKRMPNQIINGFQEIHSEISKLDFRPRKGAKKSNKVTNNIFINNFYTKFLQNSCNYVY